jgi:hypothetical protein
MTNNKNKIKLVCLGTTRQTGKDTFCKLLQEINPKFKRISLADALRSKLSGLCYDFFRKTPDSLSPAEKELFRPVLIETGRVARTIDIDFWCKELYEQIDIYDSMTANNDVIYICTDLRYLNEYHYFKKMYGESMLFINIQRDGAPEPTEEEKIYGPEVAKLADENITWHTDPSLVTLRPIVNQFYQKYFG